MSPHVWQLPPIPPKDRTPTVDLLLSISESQHHTNTTLTEQVQQLQAELARLQRRPARPEIKPSALERGKDDDPPPAGGAAPAKKRPGSNKRSKRPPGSSHRDRDSPGAARRVAPAGLSGLSGAGLGH